MEHTRRLLVHDYSGHPFQVQLSRQLAKAGFTVLHSYSSRFQTPRGCLIPAPGDPPQFQIGTVDLGEVFAKEQFGRRFFQERKYGRLLVDHSRRFIPDRVLATNIPLDPLLRLNRYCRARRIRFIYWLQDFYSIAITTFLKRRFGLIGEAIGRYYQIVERHIIQHSQAVILISGGFLTTYRQLGGPADKVHVIPNWAPLGELPRCPKENEWSRAKGLDRKFVFLYSGTLGMKHNPACLIALARHFQRFDAVRIVVVSEGSARQWIRRQARALGLKNIVTMGFQPYNRLPLVLASADVLVTLLERDAGSLSVPSKVLTNLCMGKPQLLAVPLNNLAAKTILSNRAGLVVPPEKIGRFVSAADKLWRNKGLRNIMGDNGRAYAEKQFDIERIAQQFIPIILGN